MGNFCKLYVDTEEGEDSLESAVESYVADSYQDFAVDIVVFDNIDYEGAVDPSSKSYVIKRSRFYIDINMDDSTEDIFREFQLRTVTFVEALRKGGRFVAASCDFDDDILAQIDPNFSA